MKLYKNADVTRIMRATKKLYATAEDNKIFVVNCVILGNILVTIVLVLIYIAM